MKLTLGGKRRVSGACILPIMTDVHTLLICEKWLPINTLKLYWLFDCSLLQTLLLRVTSSNLRCDLVRHIFQYLLEQIIYAVGICSIEHVHIIERGAEHRLEVSYQYLVLKEFFYHVTSRGGRVVKLLVEVLRVGETPLDGVAR